MKSDSPRMMSSDDFMDALYATVDARDAEALTAFLAEDVVFRLGNNDAIEGRQDVIDANRGFFSSIKSMSHQIDDRWEIPGGMGCAGWVRYERLDGSECSIPFATVLGLREGLVADYRVYVDVTPL